MMKWSAIFFCLVSILMSENYFFSLICSYLCMKESDQCDEADISDVSDLSARPTDRPVRPIKT